MCLESNNPIKDFNNLDDVVLPIQPTCCHGSRINECNLFFYLKLLREKDLHSEQKVIDLIIYHKEIKTTNQTVIK